MRKCLLENKELLEKYAQEVTNLKTQQHPMKEGKLYHDLINSTKRNSQNSEYD